MRPILSKMHYIVQLVFSGIKVGADNECIKCGEDGKEFRFVKFNS